MRRIFIIREDLNLSPCKLAAVVGHAAETYWVNLLKGGLNIYNLANASMQCHTYVKEDIWDGYINDVCDKIVCMARGLDHLFKATETAEKLGLKEHDDYGLIDGRCIGESAIAVGMWFAPLDDDVAKKISDDFVLDNTTEEK